MEVKLKSIPGKRHIAYYVEREINMNSKVAKTLRQFAKYRKIPYKVCKRIWNRSSKDEQDKTLPSILQFIEEAKKNDQTKNN